MLGRADTIGVSVPDFGPDELLFGVPTPGSLSLPDFILESETRIELPVFILS